jgi:cytoskeletal protein CcmA (bactofilin family)
MIGNKEKGSSTFGSSNSTTLISRDTEIIGDIKFGGSLDIEGTVRGNISAVAGKDAVVRVVDKGHVEGEIHAPSVIVNGSVNGDVHSTKHLELASRAKVEGNVHYNLVEMAIGAEVNGSLTHTGESGKNARDVPAAVEESSEDQGSDNTMATGQVTPLKS